MINEELEREYREVKKARQVYREIKRLEIDKPIAIYLLSKYSEEDIERKFEEVQAEVYRVRLLKPHRKSLKDLPIEEYREYQRIKKRESRARLKNGNLKQKQ